MKHLEISHSGSFLRRIRQSLVIYVLFASFSLFAQKKVIHQELLWYGYYNTLKINANWTLNSEIQERQFINPSAQHQLVFRTGIQRKLIENWNASVGMTLFLQSPQDPESESHLMVPELRPNIGFDNKQQLSFLTVSHRYKVEARFFHDVENNALAGGYRYSNIRIRYQLGLDIPIFKKKNKEDLISVKLKDEIMVNAGSKIVRNTFDQNRFSLGLQYCVDPYFSFEVGYMNWFQQRTSGVDYYDRDIVRLSLFHTITLKKKQ